MKISNVESKSMAFAAVAATLAFTSLVAFSAIGNDFIQQRPPNLSSTVELDADGKKHHTHDRKRSRSTHGRSRKRDSGDSSPTMAPTIGSNSRKHHKDVESSPSAAPTKDSKSKKHHRGVESSPTEAPTTSSGRKGGHHKNSPTVLPTTGVEGAGFRAGVSDGNASTLTVKLWDALHDLSDADKMGFGHQYDNYYGQFFHKPTALNQSDVYNSTGDYPLIFGYDLQAMLNGEDYLSHIMWAANQGAIIEFSWLANNPLSNGDDHECMVDDEQSLGLNPLDEILPGGAAHETWLGWLRHLASFFHKMKLGDGQEYPFLLRLFHENNEDWYWWGSTCSRNHDFKLAWEMTWKYLVEEMGVHNALFVFSPSKPSSAHFEGRYPGDEYVDIVAFDRYALVDTYVDYMKQDCSKVVDFAISHGKIPAIGETGIWEGLSTMREDDKSMWFKTDLLKPVMHHCPRIAYAFTYTNFGHDRYFIPLPGEYTYPGFAAFHNSSQTVFLSDKFWYEGDYAMDVRQSNPVQTDDEIFAQTSSSEDDDNNDDSADTDDESRKRKSGSEDDSPSNAEDNDDSADTDDESRKRKSGSEDNSPSNAEDNDGSIGTDDESRKRKSVSEDDSPSNAEDDDNTSRKSQTKDNSLTTEEDTDDAYHESRHVHD